MKRLSREERRRIAAEAQSNEKRADGFPKYLDSLGLDVKMFTAPKKGSMNIDIIPFQITESENPKLKRTRRPLPLGSEIGQLIVYVHKAVGPQFNDVICPNWNFGKPCPICEERARLTAKGWENLSKEEKDIARSLKPKERAIYNVIDKTDKDNPNEIKLFEFSTFCFHEPMVKSIKNHQEELDEVMVVDDLEEGWSVKCFANEETLEGGKGTFIKYGDFRFMKRDPFDESFLENAYPLDKMLVKHSYEDIKSMMFIASEEDEMEEEEEIPEIDEDLNEPETFVEDEVDEEMEEEEEVVEEVEKPKKKSRRKKAVCPFGHKIGKDYDEMDDCENCTDEMRDKCADIWEALEG